MYITDTEDTEYDNKEESGEDSLNTDNNIIDRVINKPEYIKN